MVWLWSLSEVVWDEVLWCMVGEVDDVSEGCRLWMFLDDGVRVIFLMSLF